MLKRNIEIGGQQPFGHQRDHRIDMGVGIDVMQAYPRRRSVARVQPAQLAREIGHVRADLASLPFARIMPRVDPVSRRVLADDQQFARAGGDQLFGLSQNGIDPAAGEFAANVGDDAEGAGMVAAFRYLQIAVMARGQLDIDQRVHLRDQIDERTLAGRGGDMHRLHHLFVLMRAGYGQNLRMGGADGVGILAQTAGHDDSPVFGNRLADGGQAFLFRAVEETAGVHQHHVRACVIGAHRISIGAQAGQDAFGIDQSFGTAQADHADLLGIGQDGRGRECGGSGHDDARPTPGTGRTP